MTDRANWKAPCVLCGYNGPGFFQPTTHPCAEWETERDALLGEIERLNRVVDAVKSDNEPYARQRNELYAMLASVAKDYDSVAYTAWTTQMHAVRELLDRMKREKP